MFLKKDAARKITAAERFIVVLFAAVLAISAVHILIRPTFSQESLAEYSFLSPGWATFGIVLPSGKAYDGLSVEGLTTQTDVKNRWPDNSIRYAILTAKIETPGAYRAEASKNESRN